MDQFNFIEEKKEKKPKNGKGFFGFIWSTGALIFFCMAIFLIGYFAMIYLDPQSQYNPFSPPTSLPTEVVATEIVDPTEEITPEASMTAEVITPTATEIVPTSTVIPPTATEVVIVEATATSVPIVTAVPTETPVSGPFFGTQVGSPVWIEHFSGSCTSMYVGGIVLDIDGEPEMDVIVQLSGTLNGEPLYDELTFPGVAPQYGESGFEFDLGAPQNTTDTAYLIVFDLDGNIISDYLIFSTTEDCSQNLTIINLVQIRE